MGVWGDQHSGATDSRGGGLVLILGGEEHGVVLSGVKSGR